MSDPTLGAPRFELPPPDNEVDASRMSLIQHLEDLRKVLIIAIAAWVVGTAIAFTFHGWIFDRLVDPGRYVFAGHQIVFFKPTGAFNLTLKVSAFGGFILALPVVIPALWTFVGPGLYKKERRAAIPLMISSLLLFALGAGIAYRLLPLTIRFLVGFGGASLTYLPNAEDYIDFVSMLLIAFGLAFELPVALVILAMVGVVTSRKLAAVRRYAWLGILLAAMVITPGTDPVSPLLLAVPLLGLFEASILVIRGMKK